MDGGTTEDAIPYLVMELIEGTRIDLFCDQHRLSITQRLQLFRQVCTAVPYAHQHLVIHRDIKPSNILVTKEGVHELARAVCETDPGRPSVVVLKQQPERDGEPVETLTPAEVSDTREGSPARLHRRLELTRTAFWY